MKILTDKTRIPRNREESPNRKYRDELRETFEDAISELPLSVSFLVWSLATPFSVIRIDAKIFAPASCSTAERSHKGNLIALLLCPNASGKIPPTRSPVRSAGRLLAQVST